MNAAVRKHRESQTLSNRSIGIKAALLLFLAIPVAASEAWWLEVPHPIHNALVMRIPSGNPAEVTAALKRVPEMVKSGKIIEIERFEAGANSVAVPVFGKPSTFKVRKGPMEGREITCGAAYAASTKLPGARELRMQTKGDGMGALVRVVTQGRLGRNWQPTFSIVSGPSSRLLLERDPAAAEPALMASSVLEVKTTGEQAIHARWFLTAQDPFLTRETIPERKTGRLQPGCGLEFEDTVTTGRGPSGQLMFWGHTLRCALLSKRSLGLEQSWTGSPLIKRAIYREAHAALTIDEPAIESAEALVYKDIAERSGELAAEESGQTTGKTILKRTQLTGSSQ